MVPAGWWSRYRAVCARKKTSIKDQVSRGSGDRPDRHLGTCHLLLVTSSARRWLLSRFIIAMKFSRSDARKVRAERVSLPRQMFGLSIRAYRAKVPSTKFQVSRRRRRRAGSCYLFLATCYFPHGRILASAFAGLSRLAPQWGGGLSCFTAAQLWPICTAFPAARKFRLKRTSPNRTARVTTAQAHFASSAC